MFNPLTPNPHNFLSSSNEDLPPEQLHIRGASASYYEFNPVQQEDDDHYYEQNPHFESTHNNNKHMIYSRSFVNRAAKTANNSPIGSKPNHRHGQKALDPNSLKKAI